MNRLFSKVILFSLLTCCAEAYAQQDNFCVRGKMSGLKKGVTISILTSEPKDKNAYEEAEIATTTVKKADCFLIRR